MKFKRLVLIILIIAWAVLVFMFSGQDGDESSSLSRTIVVFFTQNEEIINLAEPYIRKLAHFSEYGLGGCLFLLLFKTYELGDMTVLGLSGITGLWYALVDEYHQTLVPGRDGNIYDVAIDAIGCLTGACIMLIIVKIIENHKEKKKQEKFEKFKRRVRPGN